MSKAKRNRKRIKMVLPIRVWGTDSTGKPFVCLAHTLDVTPKGARIGSFTASVTMGERLGITRGMQKAHFRVAWIGRASSPTEEQIGVELLDAERDIWGLQLPSAEPDEFTDCESRAVTSAVQAAKSPAAAVSNSASSASCRAGSAPVEADSAELLANLRSLAGQLQRASDLMPASSLHPTVLEEFQSASRQMRNATHIVERLLGDASVSEDRAALILLLNTYRVQMACTLCSALVKEIPLVRSRLPRHLLEDLVQNVGNLFAQAANFEVVDAGIASENAEAESSGAAWNGEEMIMEAVEEVGG